MSSQPAQCQCSISKGSSASIKSKQKASLDIAATLTEAINLAFFIFSIVWKSNVIAENLIHVCLLFGTMVSCLFLLKIVDAMVDDGLCESRCIRLTTAMLTAALGVGLMLINEFCTTLFAGMTFGCIIAGKVDCIEFQLGCGIWTFAYGFEYFSGESKLLSVVDVLVVTFFMMIDELLHDKFDHDDDEINVSSTLFAICFRKFADRRMFGQLVMTMFFVWKGYDLAPVLIFAQSLGYDIGSHVSNSLMQRPSKENFVR